MSYKIPKNTLLMSILSISILMTIVISLKLAKDNKKNKIIQQAKIENLDKKIAILDQKIAISKHDYNDLRVQLSNEIVGYGVTGYRGYGAKAKEIEEISKKQYEEFELSIIEHNSLYSLYLKEKPEKLLSTIHIILFFLVLGDLYLIYFLFKNNSIFTKDIKYRIQEYSIRFFPEEYINDLETVRKRLKKQKLPEEEIETRITILVLTMSKGYLICQIQNLWLDRNKIE